jgi:hypothetical protein
MHGDDIVIAEWLFADGVLSPAVAGAILRAAGNRA